MFAQRTGICRERNDIAVALENAGRQKRPIIDLTLSNPTLAELAYDVERLTAALCDREVVFYRPEPFGIRSAREEIARRLASQGIAAHPDRTVLTASTSEAYGYLFKLLCEPGDALLAPQPSYPLFEHLANLESVELQPYRLRYDGKWRLDIEEIKKACTERTRAILVVSPNNPTGSFLKRGELEALSRLGLPIISDEVFSSYPFSDDCSRAQSALECDAVLVFSLFGLSKLAALPQLKLSWTCINGPRLLVEEACERLELIADTYLSVGTQVQLALPRLFEIGRPVSDAIRTRTLRNLCELRAAVSARTDVNLLDVEGGWYATLRLPYGRTDEQWALEFLEKQAVSVYPGYFFDFDEPSLVVVSLLVPEQSFDEGIERILKSIDVVA